MSKTNRSSTVAPAREIWLPRRISGAMCGIVPLSMFTVLDRQTDRDCATFSKVSELADHWLMAPCVGNFIAIFFLAVMLIANEDVRYF